MNEIHIMDGRSRVARVREYLSGTWSGTAPEPVLYNLEDHLGNSSLTLIYDGGDHFREEYFPFGESSFGSYASKRYRFCGKERDEENGLYYYGARYYAPWCCRFVSVDPLVGEFDAWSPYLYVKGNPLILVDKNGMAAEKPGRDPENHPAQNSESQASGKPQKHSSLGDSENVKNPTKDSYSNLTGSGSLYVFINDDLRTDSEYFKEKMKGWDYVVAPTISQAAEILQKKYGEAKGFVGQLVIRTHGSPGEIHSNSGGVKITNPGANSDDKKGNEESESMNYLKSLTSDKAMILTTGCNLCMEKGSANTHVEFWVAASNRIYFANHGVTNSHWNRGGSEWDPIYVPKLNLWLVDKTDAGEYYGGFRAYYNDPLSGLINQAPTFFDIKVVASDSYSGLMPQPMNMTKTMIKNFNYK